MNAHVLSTAFVATLALSAAPAAAQCCTASATPAAAMPCCADHDHASMPCCAGHDHGTPAPTAATAAPAVQTTRVTFRDPVRVGDKILLGRYVIEHDNDRMARGEPCTYIYEADDRRMPVVTFHCTHLTRPVAAAPTVVLGRGTVYPIRELREFQFAGEEASHGVPPMR
ncbi:MAG: hypothetical protein AB7H93_24555 [Vicinamibacterales bacterium]